MSRRSLPGFGFLARNAPPFLTHRVVITGLFGLLSLTGCSALQVHLGMKILLEKTPVSTMSVKLAKGASIAPGQKVSLIATFTQPDGKVLQTAGAGNGKVMWSELQLAATVVKVDKKGNVSLSRDPRVSDGKMGHVAITVPSHPDLHADLDIPFRYNAKYTANFSGMQGSSGMNGTDGQNGLGGTPGSMDPNNPSAGGNGGDGTDGSNGQDGGPGGDAPPVFVRVALQPGTPPLLQISVSASGQQKLYLLDPAGGSLTVRADGGAGGSGGRGGRGGQGGMGGTGSPSGTSGRNGMDGRDGSDGFPGRGGHITVTYDPQAEAFLNAIHLSHANGPQPVFEKEPVAPLW